MVKYYIAIGRHTMDEDERGAFVRRVDYAALQASHARLLDALNCCRFYSLNMSFADRELCRKAITAAQPFVEDAK